MRFNDKAREIVMANGALTDDNAMFFCVHAVGIRVIYVLVGNLIETQAGARDRVLAIAGGQQNIVPVSSFTNFKNCPCFHEVND
ncbi:hypothetical protein RB195_011583 [Necator americanus]|uniref:Uncharacterized protein n=1 Tax=Necator americanus TaxID=51031 RepID=A0ABR1D337_NECAM